MAEIENQQRKISNVKRYVLTFFIVSAIFFLGFAVSGYSNKMKLVRLDKDRQNLQVDVLDLETQFSLLERVYCEETPELVLAQELERVGGRLQFMESNLGGGNPDVKILKKYYSLLQIRHWLLSKKIAKDCNYKVLPIIYFYSTKDNCKECEKQGYVLSYLRGKYGVLRIYSFDYDLNLPSLETVKLLYHLEKEKQLPILIIEDDIFRGFKDSAKIEEIILPRILSGQTAAGNKVAD